MCIGVKAGTFFGIYPDRDHIFRSIRMDFLMVGDASGCLSKTEHGIVQIKLAFITGNLSAYAGIPDVDIPERRIRALAFGSAGEGVKHQFFRFFDAAGKNQFADCVERFLCVFVDAA